MPTLEQATKLRHPEEKGLTRVEAAPTHRIASGPALVYPPAPGTFTLCNLPQNAVFSGDLARQYYKPGVPQDRIIAL